MRNPFCLVPLLLSFCSCATYMNSEKTRITIFTDRQAKIEVDSQPVFLSKGEASVLVPRSNDPLQISFLGDSIHKTITVNPQNSFLYWANIPFNYGIGMLVDKNNAKRYTYPHEIYLSLKDTSKTYKRFVPYNTRKNYLLFSIPYANTFLVRPNNESKSRTTTGFLGASLSFDHYYRQNKFLRISIGAATNFPVPFLVPLDYKGDIETMRSVYLNISNNHQLGRFLLGYGVSLSRNYWRHSNTFQVPVVYYGSQKNNAAGLVLQGYYKFGRSFYLGAIYRPTFIRFPSPDAVQYEHLISLDLSWRIRL